MKLSDIFFTNSKLVWLLHVISGHGYAYAALNTSLPIGPWPWPWWMGGANLKIAFHVARHANTNKTADNKKKGSQTRVLKCAWVGASLSIITVIPHCPSCLSHVMCFSEQSHVPHVLLFLVTCGHICDIKSNSPRFIFYWHIVPIQLFHHELLLIILSWIWKYFQQKGKKLSQGCIFLPTFKHNLGLQSWDIWEMVGARCGVAHQTVEMILKSEAQVPYNILLRGLWVTWD